MAEKRVSCPSCGREASAGQRCPHCGVQISEFAWLAGLAEEAPSAPGPMPGSGVAGWYPVAGMPGQQRRWNGYQWTDQLRRAPVAAADQAPVSPDLGGPGGGPDNSREPAVDPVEQLERLAKLQAAGAITEEEFEEAKKRLLDRI